MKQAPSTRATREIVAAAMQTGRLNSSQETQLYQLMESHLTSAADLIVLDKLMYGLLGGYITRQWEESRHWQWVASQGSQADGS